MITWRKFSLVIVTETCILLLVLSHCWHSYFSLEHMLVNFIDHSILITLWLWMFILLPRTSVTQLSVCPALLCCVMHPILLRKNAAYVGHIATLHRMVRWDLMELGWANLDIRAPCQHVELSQNSQKILFGSMILFLAVPQMNIASRRFSPFQRC